MDENEKNNVEQILDIMKNGYNQYYERSQNLDNKSGFLIAFHAAIIIFIADFEKIREILQLQYTNIGQVIISLIQVFIYFSILILAIISICLFIWSLKSRNIKYLPSDICDNKYYNCKNIDLKKELLKSYKEIAKSNEAVIDRKHKIYNIASVITIIEIVFTGVSILLQICS